MTPRDKVQSVTPDAGIDVALRTMSEHSFDQLPVIADRQLVGLLRRADLVRFLHLQQTLMSDKQRTSRAS